MDLDFLPNNDSKLGMTPTICITSGLQRYRVNVGCTHDSGNVWVSFGTSGMEKIASCVITVPINGEFYTVTASIVCIG